MSSQIKALGVLVLAALTMSVFVGTASAKVAEFASEKYAATLTGEQLGEHVFLTKAGPLACKTAEFTGVLAAQAGTVSVAPTYALCTFVGKPATVTMNGCTYTLRAGLIVVEEKESTGDMTIVCPAGKEIVVTTGKESCEMKIPPTPEPVGFVDYLNREGGDFDVTFNVEFDYWLNNKCGPKEGKYEFGIMNGKSTVKGNNGPVGVL